ncbi:MAG TPA: radical SAM protein [Nitrospirota bacterium]|nr:radical SAM protein [Nitrospirota bacterium]
MSTGPDYIQFYPTLRCNRSCDFCFNRAMPFTSDMSLHQCKTMLDVLQRVSVRNLDIIGGEPTMHPDISSFVGEAALRGFSINISSNGSNLQVLREILRIREAVTAGISVNDRATLDVVREFIATQQPIVKTVYRPDIDISLVETILSLGPRRYYLLYRDATDRKGLMETLPFHEFMEIVQKKFRLPLVGTVSCSGFIPDLDQYPHLSTARCPAGTTKLGVLPDGSVYPCNLFFGRDDFVLGNILTDPFETIWNHRTLDFFRTFVGNTCPKIACSLHTACRGGCPAHSLIHTGDLSAPDPRCAGLHSRKRGNLI